MKILKEDVQSEDANFTRFFVLEKNPGPVDGADKTSVVFATKNAPGALHKCLGEFASRGVNLSKLESRPRRNKPWVYVFYADIERGMDDPDCHAAVGRPAQDRGFREGPRLVQEGVTSAQGSVEKRQMGFLKGFHFIRWEP